MSSIFTKIIEGEIPCYKVYEDERVLAFLDIHPEVKGHVLVVPKMEVDKFYDLPEEEYEYLMQVVKKLAKHMEGVMGRRVLMKIVGTDVPHTHVHLTILDEEWEYGRTLELTSEEMEEIRKKLEIK